MFVYQKEKKFFNTQENLKEKQKEIGIWNFD